MTLEEKKAATKLKRSESMKRYWSNLSQEGRVDRGRLVKRGISNMTAEKKRQRSINSSIATKEHMKSLSDAEKAARSDKLSKANRRRYEKMSDEDRARIGRSISVGQRNMDPAAKNLANKKRSESMKKYISSLTPEELQARRNRVQEWWDTMTPEQYQEWDRNRSLSYAEYIKKLETNPNKNEQLVIAEFERKNIQYVFQYRNLIVHPDFKRVFPSNPVTGSKLIDPTHKWDFRISTLEKDIYLDIDGSIHFNPSYTVTNPHTGVTFQMLDYHRFNDSQRKYQTDGLDAYVVQCPDDDLNDDTVVRNVCTDEVITFREFIDMLVTMNTLKKVRDKAFDIFLSNMIT